MSKAGDAYDKRSKERMEDILSRLLEMRSDANIMDKERVQKEKDKGSGGGARWFWNQSSFDQPAQATLSRATSFN